MKLPWTFAIHKLYLSLMFQQNETAVDVARRKEHPEIILIVTSLSRVSQCYEIYEMSTTVKPVFLLGRLTVALGTRNQWQYSI
jgi:hypothetical protein